jgi:hypothetical protein
MVEHGQSATALNMRVRSGRVASLPTLTALVRETIRPPEVDVQPV